MSKKGPVLIAQKDRDDQELIAEAFQTLGLSNELIFCSDGAEVYEFLQNEKETPFVIITDLKLPKVDALELCAMIRANEELRKKSIPFIILAEIVTKTDVTQAYECGVHGFFIKPNSVEDLAKILSAITQYWFKSVEPSQLTYQI